MRGIWQRLKDWRINVPSKRGLDVGEIFYRLSTGQRLLLVILSLAAYSLMMSGVFSANVVPHYKAIFGADGGINPGELTASLTLTASVLCLSAIPLFWKAEWLPLGSKVLMVITGLFILFTNLTNAVGTQTRAREARNDPAIEKREHITRLDAEIESATTAYRQVPAHEYVLMATVNAATAALENLKKSAYDECRTGADGLTPSPARGMPDRSGRMPVAPPPSLTRGPKCSDLEKKRDEKAEEVEKLQRNADLTQRATGIEVALNQLKDERKQLGVAPEHIDAEMEGFAAFLGDLGAEKLGMAMTKHKSMLDVIMMELLACTFASPSIMAVFWLFSLFTSHRSEADRRMVEIAKEVADERAKIVLSAVPQSPIASAVMEPDQSEEAVLGIEGQELPAFASAPETVAEAHAAALLKADPERPRERKARRKSPASKDSVLLYFKERSVSREHRFEWADKVLDGYEAFCVERNLTPVRRQNVGKIIKAELPHIIIERVKGNRTKYHGIGLRPDLKVVSGTD